MTDYKNFIKNNKISDRRTRFFTEKNRYVANERLVPVSEDVESDSLVRSLDKYNNKFRPTVRAKDPTTFAYFGSAERYYEDAVYNIINYYPFDGSREEIISWYTGSAALDIALLKQYWPGSVGHANFNYNEYVDFYAGPQSIPEAEFLGKFNKNESGLKLSATTGNTVEFWLKKESFNEASAEKEILFDIGTYPGKLDASKSGQFKMYLSASSGSPFHLTYKSGSTGLVDHQFGSAGLTKSSVADASWHHYAIRVWQNDGKMNVKTYVDGQLDSLSSTSVSPLGDIDAFMGGTIAASQGSTVGTFSGSIDDFRFWKGLRTPREITRFFDKKIYASNIDDAQYSNRLGVYYKFNEAETGQSSIDSLALDSSGNDILGRFKNYSSSARIGKSAINENTITTNKESRDPILNVQEQNVASLIKDLRSTGKSYDIDNTNSLENYIPEWARNSYNGSESQTDQHLQVLLQLMATEFDEIKSSLDSISRLSGPIYEDAIYDISSMNNSGSNQSSHGENIYFGCSDASIDSILSVGNNIDFASRKFQEYGFSYIKGPLTSHIKIDEQTESISDNVTLERPLEFLNSMLMENCASSCAYRLKRKGTARAIDSQYAALGIDETFLSKKIYSTNTDIFLEDEKKDLITSEIKSINLQSNTSATIFQISSKDIERTYFESESSEKGYTFEGSFIFPSHKNGTETLSESSIFGIHEVSAVNNNLTVSSPDRASFQVSAVKANASSDRAKFVLSSASGIISNLETEIFSGVYQNSRWQIAIKFEKDVDMKFLPSSSGYKVSFIGHNYVLGTLVNSFNLSSPLTTTQYAAFRGANKTVFMGAHRTNIIGTVLKKSDIKILYLNGYNSVLDDAELKHRGIVPTAYGRIEPHKGLSVNSINTENPNSGILFRAHFDAFSSLGSDNTIRIEDATSGSIDNQIKFGTLPGTMYPFTTTVFNKDIGNVITREFLPALRPSSIESVHGTDGINIRNNDIQKFSLSSKPNMKIFSFEKSMYNAISQEMLDFLSGVKSFNNLIGDPINTYRKNYKLIDHLRQGFFQNVTSENQFERYVNYYKWIDSSISKFLSELIPASALSNTGIENVVESHVLERNKYDHKYVTIEKKTPDLMANLMAINELSYDWEHGHYSSDEDEHCLWQSERKERIGDRETIRRVLTTVITGSNRGTQYRDYVRRNLVRPYKHSTDKQRNLSIGSNRNANKNREFYKIVNEGRQITLKATDIYAFRKCNDTIDPQKEQIYTAKIDTSETSGYLDGDADLLLPFTMYSSSIGQDFSNFKSNLKITNNHDSTSALQTPWSFEKSGMPHRRVKLGTEDKERPEAYDIDATSTTLTIRKTTAPKSMFHKSLAGSRFYHVGNIKTKTTGLSILGNYSKDYEIVMTNGRNTNNKYLTSQEGEGHSGELTPSAYVSGMTNYEKPSRKRAEHVIVNRFGAPGGPETQGASARDRASGEYSIYNTTNYRNLSSRQVYNVLSTETSERFGFRSGSATQASIHKVHRNLLRTVGTDERQIQSDNLFVSHPIPRNDFGYSWITASANEDVYSFISKNSNVGYQHLFSNYGATTSTKTIDFLTSSPIGSGAPVSISGTRFFGGEKTAFSSDFIPVDFLGLNTIVVDPINVDTNTLGTLDYTAIGLPSAFKNSQINKYVNFGAGGADPDNAYNWASRDLLGNANTLNAIILNRQGPYGWPSWKQTRGSEHPITRNHRKNNNFSVVFRGDTPFARPFPGSQFDYDRTIENQNTQTDARKIVNYKEIMATGKFKPISVHLHSVISQMFDSAPSSPSYSDRHNFEGIPQSNHARMWYNDEFLHSYINEIMFRDEEGNEIPGPFGGVMPSVSMRVPIQNKVTAFANQEMASAIKFSEEDYLQDGNLDRVNVFLSSAGSYGNPERFSLDFREMNYIETIYPREVNTYTSRVRGREVYKFFGWNSNREDRSLFLTGNIDYNNFLVSNDSQRFFLAATSSVEVDFEKSYYSVVDVVDLNSTGPDASITSSRNITGSTWVLDSRKVFTQTPVNLTSSFFTEGDSFLQNRDQGTRGEGILQNDFNMFAMGYNGLRGAPPFSALYNRRIPQKYESDVYLAGEAKWQAADARAIGPFYDSYSDYSNESRLVGQDYSLIPEFTISRFIEDIYKSGDFTNSPIRNDFLHLTGAIYHTSSGDVSIGTQFFKTYSTSDFMKYFQPAQKNLEMNEFDMTAGKLTLRCTAVKKFLPYRGFYPAERLVQISEIFHRGYMPSGSYSATYIENDLISEDTATSFLNLRLENSRAQALKPIMGPGVLFNSIKSGLAVDYPIFSSSVDTGISAILNQKYETPVASHSGLGMGSEVCFAGSLINSTVDSGIPRIKGVVSRRVGFKDILNPEKLMREYIYDNEPHPSASLMYGTSHWTKVLERPARFGTLNQTDTKNKLAINFGYNDESFSNALLPYKSAVNNFTAETVKFFLQDQKLQSISSEAKSPTLEAGINYKMRIYINNEDTVMYDRHSAFGPPVDEGNLSFTTYSGATLGTTPATAASLSLTFKAPSGYSLAHVTTESSLPAIVITDQAAAAYTYKFYDSSSGVSVSNTSTTRYINVNSLSTGLAVAQAVATATTGSNIQGAWDVGSAGAITLASSTAGTGANSNIAAATQNSTVTEHVYIVDGADSSKTAIVDEPSLSFSGGSSAAAAQGQIQFKSVVTKASDLHGSTVTIKNAESSPTEKTYIFWNSSSPSSGSTDGSGNIVININGMGSSLSSILTEAENIIEGSNGHDGTISVTNDGSNKLELTQSSTGTAGNNTITTSHASLYDLTGFSDGTTASGKTSTLTFLAAVTALTKMANFANASNLPTISLSDGDGNSHSFIFYNSAAISSPTNTSSKSYISISATNTTNANNFVTAVNSVSSLSIAATVSTNVVTLTDGTVSSTPSVSVSSGYGNNVTNVSPTLISSGAPSWVNGTAADSTYGMPTLAGSTSTKQNSHGFLPYVPPFLDPGTRPYVELSLTPSETKVYTIPEIISDLTASYYNIDAPSNPTTNTNYKESMSVSASIDFTNHIKLFSDNNELRVEGNVRTVVPHSNADKHRWVIQTRWETPILDFKKSKISALDLSTGREKTVSDSPWKDRYQTSYYEETSNSSTPYLTASTGMWHQDGEIIKHDESRGYYLTIEGAKNDPKNNLGDLATKAGFFQLDDAVQAGRTGNNPIKSVKLGRLAETKQIHEAVVAIPYYLTDSCQMKLFTIREETMSEAHDINRLKSTELEKQMRLTGDRGRAFFREKYNKWYETPGYTAAASVAYQIRMMDKYILPPHFDFVNNSGVEPHVSYVFQFKSELDQSDLASIWQNMYPTSTDSVSRTQHSKVTEDPITSDVEYISGFLNTEDIAVFGEQSSNYAYPEIFLKEDVRWLVFKVKYRAESFYNNLSIESMVELTEDVISINGVDPIHTKTQGEREMFAKYGYNWPYDYFSMVELGKIESKVDFFSKSPQTSQQSYYSTQGSAGEPQEYEVVGRPTNTSTSNSVVSSAGVSPASVSSVLVTREMLKSDIADPPTPANRLNATTGTIRPGTESLYVNGILQSLGSSNDYTISGNVLTLTYDLEPGDSAYVTYVKDN